MPRVIAVPPDCACCDPRCRCRLLDTDPDTDLPDPIVATFTGSDTCRLVTNPGNPAGQIAIGFNSGHLTGQTTPISRVPGFCGQYVSPGVFYSCRGINNGFVVSLRCGPPPTVCGNIRDVNYVQIGPLLANCCNPLGQPLLNYWNRIGINSGSDDALLNTITTHKFKVLSCAPFCARLLVFAGRQGRIGWGDTPYSTPNPAVDPWNTGELVLRVDYAAAAGGCEGEGFSAPAPAAESRSAARPCRHRSPEPVSAGTAAKAGLSPLRTWHACGHPGRVGGRVPLDLLVSDCAGCGIPDRRRCGPASGCPGYDPSPDEESDP